MYRYPNICIAKNDLNHKNIKVFYVMDVWLDEGAVVERSS